MNQKILVSLILTVFALMASAPGASATTVTSPTGTVATGGEEESVSEGHVVFDNPIAKVECAGRLVAEMKSHGAGTTASGPVLTLSFTNCTNSWHVTTISTGTLEAHYVSGYNATVTQSGATVETTRFGITCRYAVSNTDLGLSTGGNPVTMHLEGAIPFHSGSGLCGSGNTSLTGSYKGTGSAYYDA